MEDKYYFDYSKLLILLKKKGLNPYWLTKNGIYSNTVAKIKKNEVITTTTICKVCELLDCRPEDIFEMKLKKD